MQVIKLQRFIYHPRGTVGILRFPSPDTKRFWTIERPWLKNKRFESCIPEGAYVISWQNSPRFGWTYQICNVQNRDHILIHAANYPDDVQGCIGIGECLMEGRIAVGQSRVALNRFHDETGGKEWILHIDFVKDASVPSI